MTLYVAGGNMTLKYSKSEPAFSYSIEPQNVEIIDFQFHSMSIGVLWAAL